MSVNNYIYVDFSTQMQRKNFKNHQCTSGIAQLGPWQLIFLRYDSAVTFCYFIHFSKSQQVALKVIHNCSILSLLEVLFGSQLSEASIRSEGVFSESALPVQESLSHIMRVLFISFHYPLARLGFGISQPFPEKLYKL